MKCHRIVWFPKPDIPLFQLVGTSPFLSAAETGQLKKKNSRCYVDWTPWKPSHLQLTVVGAVPIPQLTLLPGLRNMSAKMSIGHSHCLCGQHLAPVLDSPLVSPHRCYRQKQPESLKTRLPTSHPHCLPFWLSGSGERFELMYFFESSSARYDM